MILGFLLVDDERSCWGVHIFLPPELLHQAVKFVISTALVSLSGPGSGRNADVKRTYPTVSNPTLSYVLQIVGVFRGADPAGGCPRRRPHRGGAPLDRREKVWIGKL